MDNPEKPDDVMANRFVSIWFRHLSTDWFALRQNTLTSQTIDAKLLTCLPFVLRTSSHGRMVITALNEAAEKKGIHKGMSLADARAILHDLQVMDDKPDLIDKLLKRLAEWCIRFTPVVAIDAPDGLLLDASGCTHLWGGDKQYVNAITRKLNERGYDVRVAMADTVGVAWGLARFGSGQLITEINSHLEPLLQLPPEALRLEAETAERLHKLGLRQVKQFIHIPRSSLRRRFGPHFLIQLDKALGQELEMIIPVQPIEPYEERLPCFEPIVTACGIEMALQQLLETLCFRLQQEQKGLRTAIFKCYRTDGKVQQIDIGTNQPSHHVRHLFNLLAMKITSIEPGLGIELFVLQAPKTEDHFAEQEKMWNDGGGLEDMRLSELMDRLASRVGATCIHRYLPDEHYWPERSIKQAITLQERPTITWRTDKLRPLQLLRKPEPIEVTAPIPDYPPMLFRYNGKIHKIVKADGPERIEQEWWIQQGQHRDYYRVEDEEGHRYWLFRLGHYHDKVFQWFVHGYFG